MNAKTLILFFLILSLSSLASLPHAQATKTSTTLYMRVEILYYPGISYFLMSPWMATYVSSDHGSLVCTDYEDFFWGSLIYVIDEDGSNITEITSGIPVAQVSRIVDGEGLQNSTWTGLYDYTIKETDGLFVEVYGKDASVGIWNLFGGFIYNPDNAYAQFSTLPLNSTKIYASTWTIYYYTKRFGIWAYYFMGDSTHQSRLENIQYKNGAIEANTTPYMLLGSFFSMPIMLALALKWRKRSKNHIKPNQ